MSFNSLLFFALLTSFRSLFLFFFFAFFFIEALRFLNSLYLLRSYFFEPLDFLSIDCSLFFSFNFAMEVADFSLIVLHVRLTHFHFFFCFFQLVLEHFQVHCFFVEADSDCTPHLLDILKELPLLPLHRLNLFPLPFSDVAQFFFEGFVVGLDLDMPIL